MQRERVRKLDLNIQLIEVNNSYRNEQSEMKAKGDVKTEIQSKGFQKGNGKQRVM